MRHIMFEFESEQDLRDTVNKLWDSMGVSGEMTIRPLKEGRWRMELHTEREVKDSAMEKFQAFRVETGD